MRDGGDASCSQNQGMRCVLSNVFGIADFLEIFSDQRTALDRPSHFISKLFNLYSSGNCGKDKHDAIQGIFSRTVGWSTIYSDREISDSTSLFTCIRKTYPLQENRPQPNQGKTMFFKDNQIWSPLQNPCAPEIRISCKEFPEPLSSWILAASSSKSFFDVALAESSRIPGGLASKRQEQTFKLPGLRPSPHRMQI